jgi:hypothetical protein
MKGGLRTNAPAKAPAPLRYELTPAALLPEVLGNNPYFNATDFSLSSLVAV